MKLKAIPLSRAKTAWGLLQDVKRRMLEEPKRVEMDNWVEKRHPEDGGPACGTVGCFAGWVCLLKGKPRGKSPTAMRILGANCDYVMPSTIDSYWGSDSVFTDSQSGGDIKGKQGTMTYARSVVKRIDGFMKRNKAKLKAKRV